jgi:hypothetical protein
LKIQHTFFLAATFLLPVCGLAQIPGILHHQGRLTVNGTNYSGTAFFKFALVNAAGNFTYWSHNGSSFSGGEPAGNLVALSLSRGIFSVALGDTSVSNMTHSVPAGVFENTDVFLRIWVDDGVHGCQQLTPDQRIGASGYALVAGKTLETPDHARTADSFLGQLAGDIVGVQSSTIVNHVGGAAAHQVANAAAEVERSTPGNVPGTLVRRDASGNVSAGTVTGTFVGDGAGLTSLNPASFVGPLPVALVESALPSGVTIASTVSQDETLISRGYRQIASLSSPSWSSCNSLNAASARAGHSSLWDGLCLLVWGGALSLGGQYINSGSMYDPEADAWHAISTIGVPEARANHSSVWTGTEMLVWGGKGARGFLGTGGRFNPLTQVWRPMAEVGAPAPRSGHIAIWTGRRLLVWGGENTTGLLNDGALYDPVPDTWAPLVLPGVPEPRTAATAVWTGTQVLIWGGQGSAGLLNTGAALSFTAQYTPANWTPLSLLNAPSARRFHSAVWTGHKLLIWGGEQHNAPLADGAAYDLFNASWETLPAIRAPLARFKHSAVWTGEEMVLFGGTTGSADLSTGAAFNPFSQTWRPITSSGNPQARSEGGMVWARSDLIVFGGVADGQPVAAPQRLTPQPAWYLYRKL